MCTAFFRIKGSGRGGEESSGAGRKAIVQKPKRTICGLYFLYEQIFRELFQGRREQSHDRLAKSNFSIGQQKLATVFLCLSMGARICVKTPLLSPQIPFLR